MLLEVRPQLFFGDELLVILAFPYFDRKGVAISEKSLVDEGDSGPKLSEPEVCSLLRYGHRIPVAPRRMFEISASIDNFSFKICCSFGLMMSCWFEILALSLTADAVSVDILLTACLFFSITNHTAEPKFQTRRKRFGEAESETVLGARIRRFL